MSELKWYSFRISSKKIEADIKSDRKSVTPAFRKLLILSVQHLIEDAIPDPYSGLKPVVAKLFEKKRFKAYLDSHLSVFYGPNTPRLSFSVNKMNIFPTSTTLPTGNFVLKMSGKSSVLGDKKTSVKASVDVAVVVTELPECDVEEEAFYHPGWFCGEIEVTPAGKTKSDTKTESSATVAAATTVTAAAPPSTDKT
ncbi:TPA_asm: M [Nymphaea alba virus 1]|uniref:M n=1 Tax=Nymphaea alba virus 1 TaxID=2793733 RepID=A0A8D9PGZ8_9RHAB|nr:M [Nymphaea alba virus 1] [Nymphaea alba virus 1]DAF42342.1 TPA_asm: M [Nymphaea alba virus 1]